MVQLTALSIRDGKGLSSLRNLILYLVEDMAASPHLFLYVVPEVKRLLKKAPKASELERDPDFCRELFALVRLVGKPIWPRQRFTALIANRSLVAIEREEKVETSGLFGRLMELDRLWIQDEKLWKKQVTQMLQKSMHPVGPTCLEAFRLLQNRLVPVMYLCIVHKAVEVPPLTGISELHQELMQWDPSSVIRVAEIPIWPDFVLDKHTAHGREKGLAHFFAEGAKVVNEAPVPPVLQRWVNEGLIAYYEMEQQFGTKGARSTAIRNRIKQRQGTPQVKQNPVPAPSKKRNRDDKDPEAFQRVIRARWEPYMPEELRGLTWAQKVTSESKRPVILYEETVWKGPFPLDYKAKTLVQERYDAVRQSSAFTPEASWVIKESGGRSFLWWVSQRIPDLTNPFEAEQPLSAIPDEPHFITQLVKAGTVKLALSMGDLCTRNMPWSPSLQTFVIIDFEDLNNKLPDVSSCSLFELCFSPERRARQEKRERVAALIRRHKDAVLKGLQEIQVTTTMKASIIEQVKARIQGL